MVGIDALRAVARVTDNSRQSTVGELESIPVSPIVFALEAKAAIAISIDRSCPYPAGRMLILLHAVPVRTAVWAICTF